MRGHAAPAAIRAVLLAVVAVGSLQLAVPAPAAAAGGRTDTASTTYTLDPVAARLDVAIDLTVVNETSAAIDFTVVWLEAEATAVRIVADRGAATRSLLSSGYGFDQFEITFQPISAGQERRLRITYQVPGGAPRSDSSTRLGRAFVSFCVISNGIDSGTARLVVPSGYELEVDAHNGTFEATTRAGVTTYQTPDLEDPLNFWACVPATTRMPTSPRRSRARPAGQSSSRPGRRTRPGRTRWRSRSPARSGRSRPSSGGSSRAAARSSSAR
ncbi:MAG TPA: hypothetical protein VFX65_14875 [Candidatus Limnocylindrales bacterium]|nr:hypothetical protein [Candidatus Limnocylindrales bacterium]